MVNTYISKDAVAIPIPILAAQELFLENPKTKVVAQSNGVAN